MLTIVELQIEILLSSSINDVGLLCRMDRFQTREQHESEIDICQVSVRTVHCEQWSQ